MKIVSSESSYIVENGRQEIGPVTKYSDAMRIADSILRSGLNSEVILHTAEKLTMEED